MDMERYGDYNEYEDDIPKSKNKFLLFLKILIIVVCFSVVGFLAFRLIIFNHYPDSIKNIYFTENLTEYYKKTGGAINAKKQDLRAPYDNPDVANFFCDNLIVIEGAGELQVSVRFNESSVKNMEKKYGLSGLDKGDKDLLYFRIYDNENYTGAKDTYITPSYVGTDSFLMYNYYKLVFDGIDFKNPPKWIRLEIFVKGQKDEKPFAMVVIYENNENYALFEEYKLSKEERPK